MKLQNSKIAFFLILFEAYGAFSAAIEPKLKLTLDLQEFLTQVISLGKGEESPHTASNFKQNPFLPLSCRHPWVLVGKTCLFTDLSKDTTWQGGRNICKELRKGSDLVVFRDANEFAEILRHLRTINSSNKKINFWVGGSDLQRAEDWLWITGGPMHMGAPFWGGTDQPDEANREHCATIFFTDRYYLHDVDCKGHPNIQNCPLCQYSPFSF